MRRILVGIAATALLASPAFSHVTKKQEKAIERREAGGETATQVQRGGLKRDQRIRFSDLKRVTAIALHPTYTHQPAVTVD